MRARSSSTTGREGHHRGERDGAQRHADADHRHSRTDGTGYLGVQPGAPSTVTSGSPSRFAYAAHDDLRAWSTLIFKGIRHDVLGEAPVTGSQGLAGPVGIIQLSTEALRGRLLPHACWRSSASTSPSSTCCPAAAGRRPRVFSIIERITGRSISLRVFERMSMVGLALFVLLCPRGHVQRHRPPLHAARRDCTYGVFSRAQVIVGGVPVGGGAPVVIQSMTNTRTDDVEATLAQIRALATAGARLVRVAVPDAAAAAALRGVGGGVARAADRRRALRPRAGRGGPRSRGGRRAHQPGQHRGRGDACARWWRRLAEHGAVIRVGVNSGSLQRDLREMEQTRPGRGAGGVGGPLLRPVRGVGLSRHQGLGQVVVARGDHRRQPACWPSGCPTRCTWASPRRAPAGRARIRSAVALGALLAEGMGDTIRVSLTGDPVEEVRVAREILRTLGVGAAGPAGDLAAPPAAGRASTWSRWLWRWSGRLAGARDSTWRWPSWAASSTGRGRPARPTSASPEERARAWSSLRAGR